MSDDPYAPTLPKAVREQVERAHQLAREAGVANVPAPADGSEITEVEQPAPQEIAQVQAELPLGDTPTEAPAPPAPDWEQRYQSLQGKYNSEMSELRGQLRAMQEMYRGQPTPAPTPEPPPTPRRNTPPPGTREIPQSDVEAYGQELIEAAQRWAEARLAPVLQDYDRRIMTVETNSHQLAQVSAARSVETTLDAALPNWREINGDKAFHAWLAQVDPFSGQTRQRLITEAYGAGDAPRTLAFFRAFVNEQTAVSPPPQRTQPVQTGSGGMPAGPAAPLPLEVLAVPGRGQTATPPAPGAGNGKRTWTRPEIDAFYHARTHGHWRGREAESAALEADLIAAQFEGRIQ